MLSAADNDNKSRAKAMDEDLTREAIYAVKEELAGQRVALQGLQESYKHIAQLMGDLVRIDTENKNNEKSITQAWKEIRLQRTRLDHLWIRVAIIAGATGAGTGVGIPQLFKLFG